MIAEPFLGQMTISQRQNHLDMSLYPDMGFFLLSAQFRWRLDQGDLPVKTAVFSGDSGDRRFWDLFAHAEEATSVGSDAADRILIWRNYSFGQPETGWTIPGVGKVHYIE